MLKEEIWIEKYRPKRLDDVVGQVEVIKRLKSYVLSRNLPHLLLSGPPGVGKTASAVCIARELFGEAWTNNFTELNASDERGIDVVRNKIKNFARTAPLGEAEFKIIFLDEADALTSDAQSALRRTMEKYTATCRFILSCNYSSKIIEPIQSRCAVYRFKPISSEAIGERIRYIVKAEGYLFSWDKIPGDDNERLQKYLKDDFHLIWAEKANIYKSDDRRTIFIHKPDADKTIDSSTVNYSVEITLDEEKEKATLKINNEIRDLKVRKDNYGYGIYKDGIILTEDGMDAIKYVAAGDMRRAINALQAAAMLDKTVNMDAIYKTTATAKPEEVVELIKLGLEGNFMKARAKLDYLLIEQGLSGEDIIGQIYRAMFDMTIPDKLKVDLIDRIGEIDFRMAEGANERIQLEALIAHFMLCGANKK